MTVPDPRVATRRGVVALGVSALVAVPALLLAPAVASPAGGAVSPVETQSRSAPTLSVSSVGVARPVARCELSRSRIAPGESVTLDASASENATSYRYDKFGTGEFGSYRESDTRTFTYQEAGTYEPRVEASENGDNPDTASCGTLTVEETLSTNFSYDPTRPAPEETVTFDPTVSGEYDRPLTFEWDWTSDGSVDATTEDPVEVAHAFPGPGEYTVTLRVVDEDGTTATAARTVTVVSENQPPTANFTVSPERPAPGNTVVFTELATDEDGEIVQYVWRVDGTRVGEGPSIEHTFETPGEYVVEQTVTDDDGATDTARTTVVVESESDNRPPSVDIAFSPERPATGETVSFEAEAADEDGSISTYEWTVDGEVVGESPALEYAFEEAGNHSVAVTVTDDDGATATASVTVTVGESNEPPSVEFAYSPSDPVAGETVSFEGSAADPDGEVVEYFWQVDGETVGEGPTLEYAFEQPGEYLVELQVRDDGGAVSVARKTVAVSETRTPTATPTETPTATPTETPTGDVRVTAVWGYTPLNPRSGQRVTLAASGPYDPRLAYRWDVDDDGNFEKEGRLVGHAFSAGDHRVTLSVTGPDGRRKTTTKTITVEDAGGGGGGGADLSIWMTPLDPRPGQRVTLVVDPAVPRSEVESYRWDFDGDGETDARGRTVTHSFSKRPTTVSVETVASNGRTNGSSATVSPEGEAARPKRSGPSLWITPLNPKPGQRVTLVAEAVVAPGAVAAYRWDFDGDGRTDARGRSVTHDFPQDGAFSVNLTVERTNGSTASVSDAVAVGNASVRTTTGETTTSGDGTTTDGATTADSTTGATSTGGTERTDGGPLPGFGVVVTAVALGLAIGIVARRDDP